MADNIIDKLQFSSFIVLIVKLNKSIIKISIYDCFLIVVSCLGKGETLKHPMRY